MRERAEPLDGPVITALAQEARRLNLGIVAGHVTREDGRVYNSAVLLDRRGNLAAVYHKTYPTISELERGVWPGDGAVVADTEFGRLGFAICYDLNFAELRLQYRDLRPDLLLFPSFYRGGLAARWWAYETHSYLVSSCVDPQSVIVNPLGRVIAETGMWSRTVTRTLNLDFAVLHYDYVNKTLAAARERYGGELEFEWAEPEGVMLVTGRGERPVRDLLAELGWEEFEDYLARARDTRGRALSGEQLKVGLPGW